MIYHVNINQKKIDISVAEKVGFKQKSNLAVWKSHYIIHQESITIPNIYVINKIALKYIKQNLIKL